MIKTDKFDIFITQRIRKNSRLKIKSLEDLQELITPEIYNFLKSYYELSATQQSYIRTTIDNLCKHNP